MSNASQAAQSSLDTASSLKYGDYNVTKDWIYIQNPLLGHGGAGVAVVNPNDPTQRFFLDNPNDAEAQQLQGFLNKPNYGTDWGSYNEGLNAQYLNNGTMDSSGRYDTAWSGTNSQTLSALAEQKRLQGLTAQYQAGTMTREQIDAAANNSSLTAGSGVQNLYQETYDATKTADANKPKPGSGMTYMDRVNAAGGIDAYKKAQAAKKVSPAVVSSSSARSKTANNMQQLQQSESAYSNVKFDDIKADQTTFYKPDPNSQQIVNYKGEKLSYDEYIAQGGKADFSNVKSGSAPMMISPTGLVKNPATAALVGSLNQTLANGGVSAGTAELVNASNTLAAQEMAATAAAREAADNKNFGAMDNLMMEIKAIKAERTKLIEQIAASMVKSPEEKASEKRLSDMQLSQQAGQIKIDGQPIPMPFLVGQGRELDKQAELKISNEIANLQRLTGERTEKMGVLKFLYDSTANELSEAIQMYQLTAPENIYSDVDEQGNLITVMKDPLTGKTTIQNLGKVGTNKIWEANKTLAQEIGVSKPFFSTDGRTIKNTQTGQEYSSWEQFLAAGGKADTSNVDWMTSDRQIEKTAVANLMDKYSDAGILPSDSLAVATDKFKKNSAIYREQVRPPSSGGGGGGGGTVTERLMMGQSNIIKSAQTALGAEKQSAQNGKANPETYLSKASEYIQNQGTVTDFLAAVPPSMHLSPNDAAWVYQTLNGIYE